MEIVKRIKKQLKKYPVFVFLFFINEIIGLLSLLKSIINVIIMNTSTEIAFKIWGLLSGYDWFESIIKFTMILVLYLLLKRYISLKQDFINMTLEVNNCFQIITDNLNESGRILNTKILYTNFYLENKNLDNDSYIKKLNEQGFSKEDLEDIGISDDFIRKNKEKLLPRNVINKYNAFKNELNQYHKNKK